MTESVLEKCVAMVCLVLLIVGGKALSVEENLIYTGIAIICAFTGLGTGAGKITLGKGGKCVEK